ncbi:MAG: hypothetical protein NT069_01445 [Planctomycetota bacterium]|nr:hypothetical protein [Planctomycetota bacterium]
MKLPDSIVDEIRKIRDEYARRFDYDLHAMCADLRREQSLSGAQIVSFAKRPRSKWTAPTSAQCASEAPRE